MTDRGEAKRTGNKAALTKSISELKAVAQRFLKRKADASKSTPRFRKIQRSKSWQWCCALDNALQCGAGVSLEKFKITDSELRAPKAPWSWPACSGVIDKGSDGVCGANFLLNKLKLNLIMDFDPSHGAWRSTITSINHSGLGTHLYLMLMAYNIGYGEWKDGTRFEQIKQSVKDTTQNIEDPEDDAFFRLSCHG